MYHTFHPSIANQPRNNDILIVQFASSPLFPLVLMNGWAKWSMILVLYIVMQSLSLNAATAFGSRPMAGTASDSCC